MTLHHIVRLHLTKHGAGFLLYFVKVSWPSMGLINSWTREARSHWYAWIHDQGV